MSVIEWVKTPAKTGLRTGLFQMPCYGFDPNHPIGPEIQGLLHGKKIQMLVYGEKLSCDLLILTPPHILEEHQRFIPDVKAADICILANHHSSKEDKQEKTMGCMEYDIKQCISHLQKYFGKTGTWYPTSLPARESLRQQQQMGNLPEEQLAQKNWAGIIRINDRGQSARASS